MMNRMLVVLSSLVLVDYVCGFNPAPAVPAQRAPVVQPQTAPNGVAVEPPHAMPGRRPAFLPPTQGSTGSFALPPTYRAGPALSATKAGQETLPTDVQEAAAPTLPEGLMGFAAGAFASLSGFAAAFLTYRSSIWQRVSPTPQGDAVELRQTPFLSDAAPALAAGAAAAMLLTSPLPVNAATLPDGTLVPSKEVQNWDPLAKINNSVPLYMPKPPVYNTVDPNENAKARDKRIRAENNPTKRETFDASLVPPAKTDKYVKYEAGKFSTDRGCGLTDFRVTSNECGELNDLVEKKASFQYDPSEGTYLPIRTGAEATRVSTETAARGRVLYDIEKSALENSELYQKLKAKSAQ